MGDDNDVSSSQSDPNSSQGLAGVGATVGVAAMGG